MRWIIALAALLVAAPAAQGQDFYQHWGDGRAELSSYTVVQPRYGAPRAGYAVLIYVTEDVNRHTLFKVESPTPDEDRIYTLKLNRVLKFTTGIYPYSVMTSVFSAVEPRRTSEPFELLKLNLSSQEWCGHVYEEVRVRDGQYRGDLFSYFEGEGRQRYTFDDADQIVNEDHLWIEIRELKGAWLAEGETRTVRLMPRLWNFRLAHEPRQLMEATIHKGAPEMVEVAGAEHAARPWTWSYGGLEKRVWVEAAYPHRILRWEDSGGGSGQLMVTRRLPYWRLNGPEHEALRDTLLLP